MCHHCFSIITWFWVGIAISIGGLFYAGYCYQDGQRNTQGEKNAEQGAAAEREVEVLLKPLERINWQIKYGEPRQGGGDIDVLLHSPKGNWYVIDVKSHGGTKYVDNGVLKRRYGNNKIHDFKGGNPIRKVKAQAKEIGKSKRAWVTPILCFTQDGVEVPGKEAKGVYIVSKKDLISILERLDSQ